MRSGRTTSTRESAPPLIHIAKYKKVWDKQKAGWKIGSANKTEASEALSAGSTARGTTPGAHKPTSGRQRNWRVA